MSDKPLLRSLPCEDCHGNKYIDGDPPDYRCVESPTGDHECRDVQAAMRIAKYAHAMADIIACEPEHDIRFSLANGIADAIDGALYDASTKIEPVWAKLDKEAFMAACGLADDR